MEEVIATLDGASIFITSPFGLKEVCKELPGRKWNPDRKQWSVPASPHSARAIRQAFGERAKLDPQTKSLADQAESEIRKNNSLKTAELPEPSSSKTPCWRHQKESFWFAESKRASMLALGMGCGKSKIVCDLVNHWDAERILIICPLSVVPVWQHQFSQHSKKDWTFIARENETIGYFSERMHVIMMRAQKLRLAVVINYDAAWREPFIDYATAIGWDAVILDESHRCKAPGGKAARGVASIAKQAGKVLALTGTPMPHSPLDIYAQFRALEPSIFGTNYHAFEQRYAIKGGFEGRQVIGYRNQDELRERFLSIAYQVDRSVLDLPEVTHVNQPVILGSKTRKVYDTLAKDFVAQVESGEIVASNALVKLLRLQQIAGGCAVAESEDGEVSPTILGTEKQDALRDILEDLPENEPVVIFCRFRHDLKSVHEAARTLKRSSLELSGTINQLPEWQNGEAPILAAQIQSGSVGVDMTRAAYVVFYSLGFSLGEYEQALARSHRPGQTRAVAYYHLIAENTVDEQVYKALRARKDAVAEILKEGL